MKKHKYDKDIEARIAALKIKIANLKYGRENAPDIWGDQKSSNLMARIDLYKELDDLRKEYGV
jgi:hypothetical protein